MMTFARFDEDDAAIVIDVWGHTLHYQVRFAAAELTEHDDEAIARAAQLWLQWQDTRVINPGDLETIRVAQERLLAAVHSAS